MIRDSSDISSNHDQDENVSMRIYGLDIHTKLPTLFHDS